MQLRHICIIGIGILQIACYQPSTSTSDNNEAQNGPTAGNENLEKDRTTHTTRNSNKKSKLEGSGAISASNEEGEASATPQKITGTFLTCHSYSRDKYECDIYEDGNTPVQNPNLKWRDVSELNQEEYVTIEISSAPDTPRFHIVIDRATAPQGYTEASVLLTLTTEGFTLTATLEQAVVNNEDGFWPPNIEKTNPLPCELSSEEGCFFLGDTGESCNEVCEAQGAQYDHLATMFATSSQDSCQKVLDGLDAGNAGSSPSSITAPMEATGCGLNRIIFMNPRRQFSESTSADSSNNFTNRVCGCSL